MSPTPVARLLFDNEVRYDGGRNGNRDPAKILPHEGVHTHDILPKQVEKPLDHHAPTIPCAAKILLLIWLEARLHQQHL